MKLFSTTALIIACCLPLGMMVKVAEPSLKNPLSLTTSPSTPVPRGTINAPVGQAREHGFVINGGGAQTTHFHRFNTRN